MRKALSFIIMLAAIVTVVIAIILSQQHHRDGLLADDPNDGYANSIPDPTSIGFLDGQTKVFDSTETVSGKKLADGSYQIAYDGHTISIVIGAETDTLRNKDGVKRMNEDEKQQWPITFSDEAHHTQTITRTYIVNPQGGTPRIPSTEPAIYLDERTYTYITPETPDDGSDPLRHIMEFSGKGLYMWIYQGLYYYNPATGKFGLDLDMIP